MFFEKPPFGLNFSDHSIEIVSLGESIEKPKLLAMSRVILEPGIVENGRILQEEELELILKNLIGKPQFGKINTNKFIFTLPESKTFIYFFELAENLDREKVEKEIESQVIHNFPFPLKDLYFDFTIKNREVTLIAAQRDTVDDFLSVFRRLQILPVALEAESLSLARSLIGAAQEIILIADIGARTTNFSFFDENRLKLSISIDSAGDKFSRALMEKLNISFQEAEESKKEIGLNPEREEGKVFLILQKEFQGIISEIKKIEEYFQKKTGKSLEKIILAGGSASILNLADYLADNLEKPVLIGDPWEKINISILKKKEYFEKALEVVPILYAPAIGSALLGLTTTPEKNTINLLPKR